MPADPRLVRHHYLAATELPAVERAAYLDGVCGDDLELRAAVELLLQAHEKPAAVLNRLAPEDVAITQALPPREDYGTLIAGRVN